MTTGSGRYVALGSSFAAGPGIFPLVSPSHGRSALNYPHLLAEELGLDLVDVTSSGATTDHARASEQVLLDGTRTAPQLDALSADTELVTVTAGGNDVDYAASLWRCSARVDSSVAPSRMRDYLAEPVDREAVALAVDDLPDRLDALYAAIRTAAPAARVVVVDSLTILGPVDDGCVNVPLDPADRAWCAGLGLAVERATADAAARAGFELVSAAAASRGHSACAAEPWVGGWEFGDVAAGGTLPYHPNAAGMRAVADLLVDLLLG